ncbi:hypothetical protein CRG98_023446 [Punica granatum]|uniref:Uncharacterized protein n=1 Tax=Punica granatum TaxID=22663 RepID=A0A2I0JIT7_PUNGR|nr:hypothetical protein CRG98_023446 [Punica granatum]
MSKAPSIARMPISVSLCVNLFKKCHRETNVSLGFLHRYTSLHLESFTDSGSDPSSMWVANSLGELKEERVCMRATDRTAWECPPSRGRVTDTREKESPPTILRPEDQGSLCTGVVWQANSYPKETSGMMEMICGFYAVELTIDGPFDTSPNSQPS